MLGQLLHEFVNIFELLIVAVAQLLLQLEIQVQWDLVLLLNSIQHFHVLVENSVALVHSREDLAKDGDAHRHEEAAEDEQGHRHHALSGVKCMEVAKDDDLSEVERGDILTECSVRAVILVWVAVVDAQPARVVWVRFLHQQGLPEPHAADDVDSEERHDCE